MACVLRQSKSWSGEAPISPFLSNVFDDANAVMILAKNPGDFHLGQSTMNTRQNSNQPGLTFACELDDSRIERFFASASTIDDLRDLGATVALALPDLSDERARVVRRLNAAGIPVTAILLLPEDDGYYFNANNWERATSRYGEWKAWTNRHGLVWRRVGLDIEPDVRISQQFRHNPLRVPAVLIPRMRTRAEIQRAREAYVALIARIRADGYSVENYQLPIMVDERQAGSTVFEQSLGLVEVSTDREVRMLGTSFVPVLGPDVLWSYATEAQAIGVGSTGGGPDIPGQPQAPALSWNELERDLRLAYRWSDELYIHSLEACVRRGYLPRLKSLDWSRPIETPDRVMIVDAVRASVRAGLRLLGHARMLLLVLLAAISVLLLLIRRARGPKHDH